MTSINLTVNGAKATATVDGILTSGSVGIPVTIEYDSIWDGLTKNLVCTSGKWRPTGTPKAILNISDSATVAPETMIADNHLYLGIEGRNTDGTLVICSTWADCGTVFAGADTDADPSIQPAMPVWAQLQAEIARLKNPTVSDTQIAAALDLYFERNPIEIPDCSGNGHILTAEQVHALDNMFKVCAFTKADVSAEYAAFKAAFGITDSGGEEEPDEPDEPVVPTVTLSSISATYSGGDVAEGTAVTDLTGIVVTAHYSDGTSAAVPGYTLSGTIAPGNNTITVTYEGKTSTFVVVGIAQSATVTVPYSEWTTEALLTKTDGSTSTVSGGQRSTFPYVEGMRVHTHMNTSWAASFPPIMVYDSGTYHKVECTQDSFVRHYYATLTGYSADAVVYVNIYQGGSSTNMDDYAYYEYES